MRKKERIFRDPRDQMLYEEITGRNISRKMVPAKSISSYRNSVRRKNQHRIELSNAIATFLNNGGKITKLPPGPDHFSAEKKKKGKVR